MTNNERVAKAIAIYVHQQTGVDIPHHVGAGILALLSAPTGSASKRECTCLGTCKGAEGLGEGWVCAVSGGIEVYAMREPKDRQA